MSSACSKSLSLPPAFTASGCFVFCNQRVLLLQRQTGKAFAGYWGLPAGKQEGNETPLETAIRELQEETGIYCQPPDLVLEHSGLIRYPAYDFFFSFFSLQLATQPEIVLSDQEHEAFLFASAAEVRSLQLMPKVAPVLEQTWHRIYGRILGLVPGPMK